MGAPVHYVSTPSYHGHGGHSAPVEHSAPVQYSAPVQHVSMPAYQGHGGHSAPVQHSAGHYGEYGHSPVYQLTRPAPIHVSPSHSYGSHGHNAYTQNTTSYY